LRPTHSSLTRGIPVPSSTTSPSSTPVAPSPPSSPIRPRRQRRGRLLISNSPDLSSFLPSPGPRATAPPSPGDGRPYVTTMRLKHLDSQTPRPAQSPAVGGSNKRCRSHTDSNNRSSSASTSSSPNHTHADGQTDIPVGRIQVRFPLPPLSKPSVRCSPHTTRHSSSPLSPHLETHSLDSLEVQFPRADPLGLGLEPQNLSTYLPKEPP
jgi:hypothetical protein